MNKASLIIAAALVFIGAGCQPQTPPASPPSEPVVQSPESASGPPPVAQNGAQAIAKLGEPLTLKTGESRLVEGGLRLTLVSIGDSRCPKDVQCVWAGELAPVFRVEPEKGGATSEELRLGTITKLEGDSLGRHFTLAEATTEDATIIVK